MQRGIAKTGSAELVPKTHAQSLVLDTLRRAKDPERKMFGYRRAYMIWAFINFVVCMLMTVLKFRQVLQGFGWMLDYMVPFSCLTQIIAGFGLFKIPVRFPFAGVGVLILFAYTIFDGILINKDIGRTLFLTLGWQTSHLAVYLMAGLAIIQAVYCGPEIRKWMKVTILLFYGFSGIIGILQLANVGWALSTFQTAIEMAIFRPIGTTDYPSQLGFEGFAGLILCGAPIVNRNLKVYEWMGVGFFALVILVAQYRSMYYAGLIVGLTPIAYFQFKRSKNLGVAMGVIMMACITVPLILFPKKFEYGLRPAANDPALLARQESWKQLQPIIKARPMTGIGPDPNLMLSSNLAKVDKWSTTSLDNYYITMYACYGYIGLSIVACIFLTILGGCVLRASSDSPPTREWAFVATVTTMSVLTLSLTGNSVVYPPVGFFLTFVLALGTYTWREELEVNQVSGLIIAVRKLLRRPLRLLGLHA